MGDGLRKEPIIMNVHMNQNLRSSIVPILLLVVFSLSLGMAYIVRVGPLSLPDPDMHCYEICALAGGQALSPSEEWTDGNGNAFRVQYASVSKAVADAPLNNEYVFKLLSLPRVGDPKRAEQEQQLNQNSQDSQLVRRRSQYNPLVYAPQAIAYSIFIGIGRTPWTAFQAVRLFSLLIALALEIVAIALLPRGKMCLALIGIMPVTIFLAVSISADALIVGLVMIFVALVARSVALCRLTKPSVVTLVAIVALLSMFKSSYAAYAVVLLALPDALASRKKRLIMVAAAFLISCALFAWWKVSTGFVNVVLTNANIQNNINWMTSHPLETACSFVASFVMVPYFFLTMPLSVSVPIALLLLYVFAGVKCVSSSRSHEVGLAVWIARWRVAVAGCVAAVLSYLTILVSLAVTWTSFEGGLWALNITGIQERYFIPMLPALALVLYPVVSKQFRDDPTLPTRVAE